MSKAPLSRGKVYCRTFYAALQIKRAAIKKKLCISETFIGFICFYPLFFTAKSSKFIKMADGFQENSCKNYKIVHDCFCQLFSHDGNLPYNVRSFTFCKLFSTIKFTETLRIKYDL